MCNWFANWRRKLKNAGKEPQRRTWGDLIKTYNNQVQGNVEHFSICSDDSIWEEPETSSSYCGEKTGSPSQSDHCYGGEGVFYAPPTETPFTPAKYKNHIMEKYLKDCQKPEQFDNDLTKPSMISKWLESAVNFKPNENNYYWTFSNNQKTKKKNLTNNCRIHGREELDAAEALTRLANNFKQ